MPSITLKEHTNAERKSVLVLEEPECCWLKDVYAMGNCQIEMIFVRLTCYTRPQVELRVGKVITLQA